MNLKKLAEAYDFAREAYKGRISLDEAPFINQPLAVAEIVGRNLGEENTVCAALLSDIVNSTNIKLKRIKERFGDEVSFLISGVTMPKRYRKPYEKIEGYTLFGITSMDGAQELFDKVDRYSEKSNGVILIELADRLCETKVLLRCSPKFMVLKRIQEETNPWYSELGRRYCFNNLADELDELTAKLK